MNFKASTCLWSCSSFRTISRGVHQLSVVKLNRTLINVRGADTFQFLQGLISNDIRQFMNNFRLPVRRSIYSLLLQTNGRTLADFILYNNGKQTDYKQLGNGRLSSDFEGDQDHSVILECDTNIKSNLLRLLKLYKLKKNVEISENHQQSIWCIYAPDCKAFELRERNDDSVILTRDPRLSYLGYRCVSNESEFNQISNRLQSSLIKPDEHRLNEVKLPDYVHHRYRLGVGEGVIDNPSGQCLPLEDNADLLNGLDFNKGCYLGQELVARTYHTGVVRKRLLPIEIIKFNNQMLIDLNDAKSDLNGDLKEKVKFGITLYRQDNVKKRLGKIRTISPQTNLGLGLLYHNELEQCNHLAANHELGLLVKVNKPIWWPVIK